MSVSTITRRLGHLHGLGLIVREGKGYALMHEGRKMAEEWKAPPGPQTKLD